jgi:uncharacterized protein with PhoU and TrkA domain
VDTVVRAGDLLIVAGPTRAIGKFAARVNANLASGTP